MMDKRQEMSDNLGTLFWDTASAFPNHTAILYHRDGQWKMVTYDALRVEATRVREAVSHHDPRTQQASKGEAQDKSQAAEGFTTSLVLEGVSEVKSHSSEVQVVGILSSGPEAVACILGILPSCGYWYLSPQYTKREVTALVERIHPERILVEETLLHSIEDIDTTVLDTLCIFGTNFKLMSTKNMKECLSVHRPETLAYVVPTSGSTGIPKCVYVPHATIMPNIYDFVHLFKVTSEDRIFCAAPLTFDPSVIDLFLAFHVGASLVMVSSSILRTPRLLLEILLEQRVTILQATVTLFLSLGHHRVRESLLSQNSWLRILALGSEVFPKTSVSECIGRGCTTKIFNLYGLTEVSCWASVWEYILEGPNAPPEVDCTPIGKPLSSTEIRVLRKTGEEVEDGGEGEIYVGGPRRVCLVDGGGGNATEGQSLTHLRATGDLGLVKDGHIYCLGRWDNQVKRNGQKVSLREIENVCLCFTYVSQCVVVPHSASRLVAFMCLCDKEVIVDDIWRDLRNCLAPWKIPDEVVFIDYVPFNAHGKVEMKGLLSLLAKPSYTSRYTHTLQDFFKEVWIRTLGCEDVREDNQFILCGGNSLTAVQVSVAVEEFLEQKIPEFLDVLLHRSYSETLQVLKKHQLARKNNKFSGDVSKKIKTNHISDSLLKRSINLKLERPEADKFSDHQSTKDNAKNEKLENVASQEQNILLVAVSRRGVQQRESKSLWHKISPCTYMLKWKFNLGKCIDSLPLLIKHAVGNTFVFVGSHSHKFVCLDAASGVERWCCMLEDRVESSPAVSCDGSFVYVGRYDYHLYCLRVEDGSVAWRYRTRGEVKSSPVVDQETGWIVFGSHDKHLHCVSVDGEAKWVLQVSSGSIFSSPCIGGGLVIAATLDGVVCGVDKAIGCVRWRVTLNKPVFSSPVIYSKGVMFGTVEGLVLSYSLTGTPLWEFKTGGSIFSSPFVLNLKDTLQVIGIGSHDGCVYFLTNQGELMAKYCAKSPVYATPFMFLGEDEYAFGAVVCETIGRCCILRVRVGGKENEDTTQGIDVEVMWKKEFSGELFASPIFYENRLWVGCRDDFLYCFDVVSR